MPPWASRLPPLVRSGAVWILPLAVLAWWFRLALGPLAVGPCEWDDTMYVDRAITGAFVWDVRNRYVHVWAVRIVDKLLPTHRSAAEAWAALCVCTLAALGFYAGKRLAGLLCGFVALGLTLLFPPLFKYLSVPHVDFSLALFGTLAVLAAALAVDTEHAGLARGAALVSGICSYLALKSKETGLVVAPLCALLLWGSPPLRAKWPRYVAWAAGLGLGLLLLLSADRSFVKNGEAHSSDLRNYFSAAPEPSEPPQQPQPARPRPNQPARVAHDAEVIDALLSPDFAAFTLLGCAGFVRGARRSVWARALGLWALSVIAFTALISIRFMGIDAQDRYLVAAGAGLAPLAAYQLITLVREPQPKRGDSLAFTGLLVAVVAPALWGMWRAHTGSDEDTVWRAVRLTVPLAMVLLFLAAWFTPRWLAASSAALLLAMSVSLAIDHARDFRLQRWHELAPWNELAQRLDERTDTPRIAVLHGRSYRAGRLRWRLRVLSRHELLPLNIRDVENMSELAPEEWVFVGAERDGALEAKQYQVALALRGDPRPWTLYTPPQTAAPQPQAQP